MFAMNMTRQREKDANKARQKEAIREAYDRKLQRELAKELAKNGGQATPNGKGADSPGTPTQQKQTQFFETNESVDSKGSGKKSGSKSSKKK